jgi:ORF6N domain-containing protein
MNREAIPVDRIAASIHIIRGQKVILDSDLAVLYGVTTKALNQAVKRNAGRFPADFMFWLSAEEVQRIGSQTVTLAGGSSPRGNRSRSQIVTLKRGKNIKYRPHAFTEQGVAMLSSVLRSERAVQVNIAIMRAFVQLRSALESNRELARKFAELEERVGKHDEDIGTIIEAIRQLLAAEKMPRREIGFHVRESSPRYGTRKHR